MDRRAWERDPLRETALRDALQTVASVEPACSVPPPVSDWQRQAAYVAYHSAAWLPLGTRVLPAPALCTLAALFGISSLVSLSLGHIFPESNLLGHYSTPCSVCDNGLSIFVVHNPTGATLGVGERKMCNKPQNTAHV